MLESVLHKRFTCVVIPLNPFHNSVSTINSTLQTGELRFRGAKSLAQACDTASLGAEGKFEPRPVTPGLCLVLTRFWSLDPWLGRYVSNGVGKGDCPWVSLHLGGARSAPGASQCPRSWPQVTRRRGCGGSSWAEKYDAKEISAAAGGAPSENKPVTS